MQRADRKQMKGLLGHKPPIETYIPNVLYTCPNNASEIWIISAYPTCLDCKMLKSEYSNRIRCLYQIPNIVKFRIIVEYNCACKCTKLHQRIIIPTVLSSSNNCKDQCVSSPLLHITVSECGSSWFPHAPAVSISFYRNNCWALFISAIFCPQISL